MENSKEDNSELHWAIMLRRILLSLKPLDKEMNSFIRDVTADIEEGDFYSVRHRTDAMFEKRVATPNPDREEKLDIVVPPNIHDEAYELDEESIEQIEQILDLEDATIQQAHERHYLRELYNVYMKFSMYRQMKLIDSAESFVQEAIKSGAKTAIAQADGEGSVQPKQKTDLKIDFNISDIEEVKMILTKAQLIIEGADELVKRVKIFIEKVDTTTDYETALQIREEQLALQEAVNGYAFLKQLIGINDKKNES
jgi:hypothetical protein